MDWAFVPFVVLYPAGGKGVVCVMAKLKFGRNQKILIIYDDPHMHELIGYNLKQRGYQVIRALSGEEGIREAEKMPDAILLDIMMPVMPGYEVAKQLKANDRTKNIPIVMLTGEAQPDAVEKAFEAGAADYIVKPFAPATLMEKIVKVLG
jgi:two-component system phosphate regulon response regulator PhoB